MAIRHPPLIAVPFASAVRRTFACLQLPWSDAEAAAEQAGEVHRVIEAAAERDIANSLASIGAARKESMRAAQARFPYVISHRNAMRGKYAVEVGTRAAELPGNQLWIQVA